MPLRVAVLGGGSFGTTVASLACRNAPALLWARRGDLVDEINREHRNERYLPGFALPASLRATDSLEEAVGGGAGFFPWEQDGRAIARSMRWTGPNARFAFLQRPEWTTLFLQGYTERARFSSDPTLTLRVGDLEAEEVIRSDDRRVLRLDIPGNGTAAIAEGSLEMDSSFQDRGQAFAFCVERFRAVSLSQKP
jgi:hypothetical protein